MSHLANYSLLRVHSLQINLIKFYDRLGMVHSQLQILFFYIYS